VPIKQLIISFFFLVAFATVSPPETRTSPGDKAAIGSIVSNFETAWAKCDAKALAALWTKVGDFQSPYNSFAKGRAEIETFYSGAFGSGYCKSKAVGKIDNIRFVQVNLAIIDGTWHIKGARDQNGHEAPEEKGRFTAVVEKQNSAWLIVAQREMIPAVPH
jgi:uncharacterized protein (TIGR02246 family)